MTLLSKDSRIVLRIAKQNTDKSVAYLDLKAKLNWDFDKIKSVCNQLVSAGLATEKYHSPLPGSQILWGIILSEEGRNSKKYFFEKMGVFFFKSIVVPITVAFITAILTTLAMLWFQR